MFYWLDKPEILAQQRLLIDIYGGAHGVLNEGALDSTLARPVNLNAYEGVDDPCRLAACYGYGFAKNHCFVDGNKRVALVTMDVFLGLHDLDLCASEPEAVAIILALCTDDLNEDELARWLRLNTRPLD
ncbi:type II toxin-antitoxin system death-on-curing family toxin [Marinihelvus fidelis]|uniref:type II toxin-antitoxin system death-on-curing family toxin n=1 Tax=Marinihelvus fidelis TaxID=2613842 RepID=UPI001783D56F|nr:type II toxin-antitoxin system death-on-curing family toxin [Marinihelvus fidelis]